MIINHSKDNINLNSTNSINSERCRDNLFKKLNFDKNLRQIVLKNRIKKTKNINNATYRTLRERKHFHNSKDKENISKKTINFDNISDNKDRNNSINNNTRFFSPNLEDLKNNQLKKLYIGSNLSFSNKRNINFKNDFLEGFPRYNTYSNINIEKQIKTIPSSNIINYIKIDNNIIEKNLNSPKEMKEDSNINSNSPKRKKHYFINKKSIINRKKKSKEIKKPNNLRYLSFKYKINNEQELFNNLKQKSQKEFQNKGRLGNLQSEYSQTPDFNSLNFSYRNYNNSLNIKNYKLKVMDSLNNEYFIKNKMLKNNNNNKIFDKTNINNYSEIKSNKINYNIYNRNINNNKYFTIKKYSISAVTNTNNLYYHLNSLNYNNFNKIKNLNQKKPINFNDNNILNYKDKKFKFKNDLKNMHINEENIIDIKKLKFFQENEDISSPNSFNIKKKNIIELNKKF